jgi:hypothetical protein
MWKLGWGLRKHRPDRLGLVVESPGPGCGIFVKEVRPGALKSKEGKKVIGLLKRQEPVFITGFLAEYALGFTGTRQQLNECVKNLAALPGTLGEATRRFLLERARETEEKAV